MNWRDVAEAAASRAQLFLDRQDCNCSDPDAWDECWYRYTPAEKWKAMVDDVAWFLELEFDVEG